MAIVMILIGFLTCAGLFGYFAYYSHHHNSENIEISRYASSSEGINELLLRFKEFDESGNQTGHLRTNGLSDAYVWRASTTTIVKTKWGCEWQYSMGFGGSGVFMYIKPNYSPDGKAQLLHNVQLPGYLSDTSGE